MSDRFGEDLIAAIRMNRRAQHDTLYCNMACKSKIIDTIDGRSGSFRTSDNVQIAGLQVETHERFDVPITCKKGDIFPLTEDHRE